jgi:hypothetical protein
LEVGITGHNFGRGPFHQSLVAFGPVVSVRKKGDEIFKKSSPLKLLSQSQPNFTEMILGWPPSKIVSDMGTF